jgi:tRNA (cmo5U34)-methyltransferase
MNFEKVTKSKLNAYDAIAPFYDSLARIVFGKSVVLAQVVHFSLIPPNPTVLILGGGTGWLLEELLGQKPQSRIWYLEASVKMMALAKKRVSPDAHVHFIHGDLNSVPHDIQYDVVIANFFLDQFSENDAKNILAGIKAILIPEGLFLIADFQTDRLWKRIFAKAMYWSFAMIGATHVYTMPPWVSLCSQSGFRPVRDVTFYGSFIRSIALRP